MISEKIVDLYKRQRITLEELAEKIGMSKTGLHNALKSGDFKISTLARISKALEVPVSYFFEENSEKGKISYKEIFDLIDIEIEEVKKLLFYIKRLSIQCQGRDGEGYEEFDSFLEMALQNEDIRKIFEEKTPIFRRMFFFEEINYLYREQLAEYFLLNLKRSSPDIYRKFRNKEIDEIPIIE